MSIKRMLPPASFFKEGDEGLAYDLAARQAESEAVCVEVLNDPPRYPHRYRDVFPLLLLRFPFAHEGREYVVHILVLRSKR